MNSDTNDDVQHFIYSTPITILGIVMHTTEDFFRESGVLRTLLVNHGIDQDIIDMTMEALGPESCPEEADAIQEFIKYELQATEIDVSTMSSNLGGMSMDDSLIVDEETNQALQELSARFNMDFHALEPESDKVTVPDYIPTAPEHVTVRLGLQPPRPPTILHSRIKPIEIVFTRTRSRDSFRLRSNAKWSDYLDLHMPEGSEIGDETFFSPSWLIDGGSAASSMVSSTLYTVASHADSQARSNSRPRGGMVYIVLEGGQQVNVGAHSYPLSSDAIIPLDVCNTDQALSELFMAPGGEGLACATGSHSLHQMVSAALSHAIYLGSSNVEVECEMSGMDIRVKSLDDVNEIIDIDITSTAGIWRKPLREKKMAALSKYDLAAIFIRSCSEGPASCFARGVAACLAVEHPAYYGSLHPDNMMPDLLIQDKIVTTLSMMSQQTCRDIAHMSFDAMVAEAVDDMKQHDLHAEGIPYTVKAQKILDKIVSLGHDEKYAHVPIPLSPICGMLDNHNTVDICGYDFKIPSQAFMNTGMLSNITVTDPDDFLKYFPADGRIIYSEASQYATWLQENVARCSGLVHKGPIPEPVAHDNIPDLWAMTGEIYASSSYAQFAEIRADVVRAIDMAPAGNLHTWRASSIYKNKVILYHRVRDRVNDARGYRIDWFALSAFEVTGSVRLVSKEGNILYLWPRQRLRSQEMEHAAMAPRRLKLVLYSMINMMRAAGSSLDEVVLAWQKLAVTVCTSTWASGANFITCRHLSASLSSPSTPFDAIAKKMVKPRTFADLIYFSSLSSALNKWTSRDQYRSRAALLGLPRPYQQLESYWQIWVPDELADADKHFTDCVLALYGEFAELEETMLIRCSDLSDQLTLLSSDVISYKSIRDSIRASCSLETGGKYGWSVFGSMASAYALNSQGQAKNFDKVFSRGKKARTMADHLTVRHSGRKTKIGAFKTGTVAQMMLDEGLDPYMSTLTPANRFFYGDLPYFMNHPKNGELKDREISITDPDTRVMLTDAEYIVGEYGKHTRIDMLKRRDKDAYFYKVSSEAFLKGGVVMASDASRFAAMMSNNAVGITCYTLGMLGGSAHLQSAACVYWKLAHRWMTIDTCVIDQITKRLNVMVDPSGRIQLDRCQKWLWQMKKIGHTDGRPVRGYMTAAHTGQGMSHHGMSILHGGALLVSLYAAEHAQIHIGGSRCIVAGIPLVTSDDSSIVASLEESEGQREFSRAERQRACHIFLRLQQVSRQICLRSVSVLPNLAKEKVSGTAGEFNSQDNGIGISCPILGFRELVCQLTRPSSTTLISDYLNAAAYARSSALVGMGQMVGCYAHMMYLDALEQRWQLRSSEKQFLSTCNIIPSELILGIEPSNIYRSPASMLPHHIRRHLVQLSIDMHAEMEIEDIHVKDSTFTSLGHISMPIKLQHKKAIQALRNQVHEFRTRGRILEADCLEQSLSSTLSSARSRGAGRVATRCRARNVTPKPILGKQFTKSPLIEATLTWIDFLASSLGSIAVSPDADTLSLSEGAVVYAHKHTLSRFPEPVTRRRSPTPTITKPRYVLRSYGYTPFGCHALTRSGAEVIDAYGPDQRKSIARYNAAMSYRKIPEHNLYGGKLVTSWWEGRAASLTVRQPKLEDKDQAENQTFWGGYTDDDITFFRDLESVNEGYPVLSLTWARGNTAFFHCIYKGKSYFKSQTRDVANMTPFSYEPALANGGVPVVLAVGSFSTNRDWSGTGPTAIEIQTYQHDRKREHGNVDAQHTFSKVCKQNFASVPLAACMDTRGERDILYVVDPKLTYSGPEHTLPYHKAKFLINIATGGYWFTSLGGVSVRAYLRGHYGPETSWPGQVGGWRMSMSQEPDYSWEPPGNGMVHSITVVHGIDDEDTIGALNPSDVSKGDYILDGNGMRRIEELHKLSISRHSMQLIIDANEGNSLYATWESKAQLIDCELPAPSVVRSGMTSEAALDALYSQTHEVGEEDIY